MPRAKRTSTRRKPIRRIAINTGGGDAPGLNAVIRAVVLSALNEGWEVVGIRDGYNGIFKPEEYPDGGLVPLDRNRVRGITHLGGTIIGTTNRGNPLKYPTRMSNGALKEVDRTDDLIRGLAANDIDAVVGAVDLPVQAVGGLSIDQALETVRRGARSVVIGAPLAIQADRFATGDEFEEILRDVVTRVRGL